MATHVVLSPDVREKLLSECSEITNFLDWLESIDRRPGLTNGHEFIYLIQYWCCKILWICEMDIKGMLLKKITFMN